MAQPSAPLTPEAYNACVEAHSDALFRFALRHTRDRDQAKDVVQESFMRLWTRLHAVEPGKEKSYLFATAHNFMVSSMRRSARVVRMETWHEDRRSCVQGDPLLRELIDQGLARLPLMQRRVVELRDREGYTYDEIAERTGLSMDQVKVFIYRGRRAMQRYLGPKALVA